MVGSSSCMTPCAVCTCSNGSELGEFFLGSDSVIATFTRWKSMRRITQLFTEEENEAFMDDGYTIGGMMVFPAEPTRW